MTSLKFNWTFCGVQVFSGYAGILLVNDPDHSTKALVAYTDDAPVVISFVGGL